MKKILSIFMHLYYCFIKASFLYYFKVFQNKNYDEEDLNKDLSKDGILYVAGTSAYSLLICLFLISTILSSVISINFMIKLMNISFILVIFLYFALFYLNYKYIISSKKYLECNKNVKNIHFVACIISITYLLFILLVIKKRFY